MTHHDVVVFLLLLHRATVPHTRLTNYRPGIRTSLKWRHGKGRSLPPTPNKCSYHECCPAFWRQTKRKRNKLEFAAVDGGMESSPEFVLVAVLFLSCSVFGFPLDKDTEQTCGYKVSLMVVSFLIVGNQIKGHGLWMFFFFNV